MKLVCSKPQLVDIINTVQRAIAPKTSLPILECIKIDANGDGNVVFTGNNIDICIEYNTECTVTEGGTIALASKMFGEIVRRLPDGDVTISVNPSNYVTKIKSGSSEFNIQGIAPDEFPDAPILEEKFRFSITQDVLKKLIRKTIAFVSQNEGKKPVLTGALFEIKNNYLNVVASDGHRLAVVKEEINDNVENNKLVVPGMTLRELLKILKDDEENVDIIVSDRTVLFDFGYYQVPVRFNIGYDKIDVSCITGKGQVNDTVPVELDGDNLLIGFNCRFLLDALSACDEEKVKMEFSAPTSGCFIKSVEGDDSYIYMILPVRLYN